MARFKFRTTLILTFDLFRETKKSYQAFVRVSEFREKVPYITDRTKKMLQT